MYRCVGRVGVGVCRCRRRGMRALTLLDTTSSIVELRLVGRCELLLDRQPYILVRIASTALVLLDADYC